MHKEVFEPIIDCLSDNKIHSVKSIQKVTKEKNISNEQLFRALAILQAKDVIHLVQDDEVIEQVKTRCQTLNKYLLKQNLADAKIYVLVSPLTGGAVVMSVIKQIFLCAYTEGYKEENEIITRVRDLLAQSGRMVLNKDGKQPETEEEVFKELKKQFDAFQKGELKFAKQLLLIND